MGVGFEQRSKPVPRRTAQALLDGASCPLQRGPLMLRLGLQQRRIGGFSRGELLLLKQLVSSGAGRGGAGGQKEKRDLPKKTGGYAGVLS